MGSSAETARPIRLGMIGCGTIAQVHGEAMQASADAITFGACADLNVQAAEAFAARFGAPKVYSEMIEMVSSEQLDGVILATWPAHHHEHVAALIDAGVRFILCEKSLSISGPRAAEMMEKAHAADVTLIEAFMLRHHPLYRQFEGLVRAGEAGAIDTIRASFQECDEEDAAPGSDGLHWRRQMVTGGGIAYDGTCYPLHVCSHLANSLPFRVAFDGTVSRYGTLSRLHGYIRYENGITGLIHSSLRAVVGREAEVSGTKASLYLPIAFGFNIPAGDAIRRRTGRSNLTMKDEIVPPVASDGAHENRLAPRLQLENFADIIRCRAPVRVPLAASVVNAFTLDAMICSAETGSAVDVVLPQAVRDAWERSIAAAPRDGRIES